MCRAKPKSMSLAVPAGRDDDVRRLDVAVDEAGVVDGRQPVGDLGEHAGRLAGGHRAVLGDDLLDRPAGGVLHGDVRNAADLAGRVHAGHVRVVGDDPADGHLAVEAVADARPRLPSSGARIFRAMSGRMTFAASVFSRVR